MKTIIIIDEYGTPIQQGHTKGFYDEVILFMRNLFSGGLKDNRHLSYGFLTGILRVAQESIFSGLNNLKINSILDNRYSEYFGFTSDEVHEMAEYYGVKEKYVEICEWYDGYRFGRSEIFNPWSVINYFSNECEPKAFWLATGSNDIIREILQNAEETIIESLEQLLLKESFVTYVDTDVIYPEIRNNPSSIYSFLLMAGYLKLRKKDQAFDGNYMCELSIPNKEITFVYRKEILERVRAGIQPSIVPSIQKALYLNDANALQRCLKEFLYQTVSYFDSTKEAFYHGLLLGLCAMMTDHYYVTSNREAGNGRYDIQLMPKSEQIPGILIEIKAAIKGQEGHLEQLAEEALKQIAERKYSCEMETRGVEKVWKYGVSFNGKDVVIRTE